MCMLQAVDETTVQSTPVSFCKMLNLLSVTEKEVLVALKSLKVNFISGHDGISGLVIHKCALSLLVSNCVIQLVLSSSTFPSAWKTSRICSVYKSGPKTDVDNYRPLSILCNFSKVYETILFCILSQHVSQVMWRQQHGFIKDRSVTTNFFVLPSTLLNPLIKTFM